jgi:hypothetical protein
MAEDVNRRILDKIKESETSEAIKEFLTKVAFLELQHFEEDRWIFSKEYEKLIRGYVDKFEVDEE